MAQPHQHGAGDRSEGEGTPKGRRLGRILIPLGILLVIAGIFTYLLVVAQTRTEDQDDDQGAAIPAVVLEMPEPLPA
ncbi:hypothetical protein [Blastococcus sp. SYSU DS1024]